MVDLNFYSEPSSQKFLTCLPRKICFLGSCTARNLAHGIRFFSDNKIETYSPYETIFNAPSLLKDLEIIIHSLDHSILINENKHLFQDSIRFWNHSEILDNVIKQNEFIDSAVINSIQNCDLVVISMGAVEMWAKSNHVLNRLPKELFTDSTIQNIYLDSEEIYYFAKELIRIIKSVNPDVAIQFSIPYVLLKASEKYSNLYFATMENYRIIKNAIMKLGKEYYFPEFELFKYYVEHSENNFQEDDRHPSVALIAKVSKQVISEINREYLNDGSIKNFYINKVDSKGKVNGNQYLL